MPAGPFPPHCASRFRPERLLGEGGFGSVWLATQVQLERPVAIKFIRTDVLADRDAIDRFNDEARVTASLSHASIVRVIDHDVEDGVPWIAYEYLPGRSLADVLASGPMPWKDALEVGEQVAGALEEAHRNGVVHRDVKAENVVEVSPGHYKLADFGIAKWTSSTHVKTRTGFIMGTPTHVPPEQIKGEPPSPQGDIYALGVMMYQALTGQLPFPDENVLSLLRAHLEERVRTPSRLQEGLPGEVDLLVKRALEKEPGKRFADAGELRRAIEEVKPAHVDESARPAVEAPVNPRSKMNTSRAGIKRPPAQTRTVSRADAPPVALAPSSAPSRRIALAIGAVLGLVTLGAVIALGPGPRPVVTSPAPVSPAASASTSPAPAVVARTELPPGYRDRSDAIGEYLLKVSGPAGKTDEALGLVEKMLRALSDNVEACDKAGMVGPNWSEEVALSADQVMQKVARLGDQRNKYRPIMQRLDALKTAVEAVSGDDHRRAFAACLGARYMMLSEKDREDAAALFEKALRIWAGQGAWSSSLAGLKVRLTFAFQRATAYQAGNPFKDPSPTWADALALEPVYSATVAPLKALSGKDSEDFWECSWQLMRLGHNVQRGAYNESLKALGRRAVESATLASGRIVLPVNVRKRRAERLAELGEK